MNHAILLLFLTTCQFFLILTAYIQYKLHQVILIHHMAGLGT
jgi:hypothetical protein